LTYEYIYDTVLSEHFTLIGGIAMTLHTQPPDRGCQVIPFSTLLDRRRTKGLHQKKAYKNDTDTKTPCILYPNPNGITVEDIVVDVIRF